MVVDTDNRAEEKPIQGSNRAGMTAFYVVYCAFVLCFGMDRAGEEKGNGSGLNGNR